MRDNLVFIQGLRSLGLDLEKEQLDKFDRYYNLLIEWNSFMNLTAITEYEEVIQKHFLDSLSLIKSCKINPGDTLLDMGTGAGFPGIPLKIAFPELEVLLMDSLNKRINFLNEVITKLELNSIKTLHARAEEQARKEEYREQFDLVVSRAVARTASLVELCLPYVKKGGYFIPYKSGKVTEELEEAEYALECLGGKLDKKVTFTLPDTDVERTLICIRKVKQTPKAYPRAGGKPLKMPLMKKNSE